jgi:hypothetical protein
MPKKRDQLTVRVTQPGINTDDDFKMEEEEKKEDTLPSAR